MGKQNVLAAEASKLTVCETLMMVLNLFLPI